MPFGSFSISGCAMNVNSSFGVDRARNERDRSATVARQQPVAQLEQVRDQRAFGEVLAFLRVVAHGAGRESSSRGVVRSSSPALPDASPRAASAGDIAARAARCEECM